MTIIIIILDRRIIHVNSRIAIGTINRIVTMTERDTVIAIQPMTIGELNTLRFVA